MSTSDETDDTNDGVGYQYSEPHPRIARDVSEHEERITRNERWRLQLQGALKVIIGILGTGIVGVLFDVFII
jgi:hypothetical protein